MRKVKDNPNWKYPKTWKTDFTTEEMLDIIDFYLQYKPMLDEYVNNRDNYPQFDPHDFTRLLYMYEMLDVNYIAHMDELKKKYKQKYVDGLSGEKLDFLEIITIFTQIHRENRSDMYYETYEYCIKHDIYYNLLCRLEEIKNELEKL